MSRIIFVPNTLAQLQKFQPIIHALPADIECILVIIDRFKSDGVLAAAKTSGLHYVELGSMNQNGVDLILEETKPMLIVLGNDIEVLSKLFIDAAKSRGIPNLLVQDGTICPYNYVLPISPEFAFAALSIYGWDYLLTTTLPRLLLGKLRKKDEIYRYGTYAQYVAVWGSYTKDILVGMGANPEHIFVTGSSIIETSMANLKNKKSNREAMLRAMGADPAKKTLVFAPSDMLGARLYTRKEIADTCQTICQAVQGQKDLQLIIKPHPSFIRREPAYFNKYKCENIFVTTQNPYDLLSIADGLISDVSSMMLEAVAYGLPVMVANVTGRAYPCEPYPRVYVEEKVALLLTEKSRAKEAIRALLDNSHYTDLKIQQKKFIHDQLFELDGKSAMRIADLIIRLIRKSNSVS